MKQIRKLHALKWIFNKLSYFGDNSNIHGLRFVSENHRHIICKIFWFIAIVLCGWGLLEILKGTIKSAQNDALNFTPDTNRINWNTTFPSVSICEKYNYHQALRTINKVFPKFLDDYDFDYKKMFADTFFGEAPCNLCNADCGTRFNCSINWRSMAAQLRQPCAKLIHGCNWMNNSLDCCKYFLPVDSNLGTCYSFNTRQSRLSGSVPLFQSNRKTGPGYLSFYIYKNVQIYIHGTEDIPWIRSELDSQFEAEDGTVYSFSVIEMDNDYEVRDMDLKMRKCLYPDELPSNFWSKPFNVYGYMTCMVMCETELMYKKCQCINHLRDDYYRDHTCNYTGLGCLALYDEEMKKQSAEDTQILCSHCLPSCNEIEIHRVFYLEYEVDDDADPKIDIIMTHLPNVQYRRNVVRSKLDLVVSVGGLAGLFFGASLLSLVEAAYILFIRARQA